MCFSEVLCSALLLSGPGLSADDGFEVDNLPVETYQGADRQIATAVVSSSLSLSLSLSL
eukprot:COSAG03_NODE_10576_length_642_cov_1.022099_1_plen_58_part_10